MAIAAHRSEAPGAPISLRTALVTAGPLADAAFFAKDRSVPLASMARGSVLGEARAGLAGRSVMLVTGEQLMAALAMIDLDGLVARLVICPPDLRPEHRASVIADAGVEVVVTDADPSGSDGLPVTVVSCALPVRELVIDAAPAVATEWVLATSGTSGLPKLVVHSLAALTGAIRPATAGRPVVWGTFYDIRRYGGLQIFLRAVLGGTALVLSDATEPVVEHLWRLRDAGITHMTGTPSHWRRVLMSSEAATIKPDYARLSGEIADQAVLDGLVEAYPGAKVGHAYASTEAGVGFEVTDGREGFPGAYLGENPPVLRDPAGFVDSGDLVEQRGDRLFFVGRRSGIINVGGLKVHPEEIEAVINRHEGVRMSLVKARKSPITGAIVVADVVLNEGIGGPEDVVRAEIMRACRENLPGHKVPATVRFVPTLAVTPAGKLARNA